MTHRPSVKAEPALPFGDEAYGALLGREGSAWHARAHTHRDTHTCTHDLAPSAPPCAASCWLSVMMDVSPCAAQLCLPPTPLLHSGLTV